MKWRTGRFVSTRRPVQLCHPRGAGTTAFKAICGSSPATAATFASVAVPEMDRSVFSVEASVRIPTFFDQARETLSRSLENGGCFRITYRIEII